MWAKEKYHNLWFVLSFFIDERKLKRLTLVNRD